MDFLLYLVAGTMAGLLAGLFGIGGGLVIVPMLLFLFGQMHFPENHVMHLALGTSFATIMFTSISSARAHHFKANVDWRVVRRLALPVMGGTFTGSLLAAWLDTIWLKIIFALFVLFAATQLLLNLSPNPGRQLHGRLGMSVAGGGIGLISSLVGIGGGTLTVPYLVYCNMNIRRAVGASAAIGFPIAAAGTLGYVLTGLRLANLPEWSMGFVYLPAFAGITIASIFAAPIGAALAHRLPMHILKRLFALLLYAVAINMLSGVLVTAG